MAFEGQVTIVANKRVYVVSTGSYDSYRVLCAAPNKKTADEFVEKAGKAYRVEHIPVYTEYLESIEYVINLSVSADIVVLNEDMYQIKHPMFDEDERQKPIMGYSKYRAFGKRGFYNITVRGADENLVKEAAYAIKDILVCNPELRHRASSVLCPKFNAWKKERGIK